MQNISEGKSFLFNSLLSTRKNLRLEEVPAALQSMLTYYHDDNHMLSGACIVQIKSGEVVNNGVVYDLELLMPVQGNTPVPSSFSYVPRLLIGNCVSLCYQGTYADLGSQHIMLYQYLQEHNLESVTGIYHIFEHPDEFEGKPDSMNVDICIGTRKSSFSSVRTA